MFFLVGFSNFRVWKLLLLVPSPCLCVMFILARVSFLRFEGFKPMQFLLAPQPCLCMMFTGRMGWGLKRVGAG